MAGAPKRVTVHSATAWSEPLCWAAQVGTDGEGPLRTRSTGRDRLTSGGVNVGPLGRVDPWSLAPGPGRRGVCIRASSEPRVVVC